MGAQTCGDASAISFRQLRLLAAIAEHRSARRVAVACSLSQPAVTQSLSKLEQQVGATLIERRPSGSYLSELGRIFHARVQRFFDQTADAVVEARPATSLKAAAGIVDRLSRTQVHMLIGLVEFGSLPRASEALDLSVSSLQRAARDLESSVRHPLFHRSSAGLSVNPTGARLGRRLKLALQEIEWGLDEVEAANGAPNRQIVIGAMPFGGSLLLSSVLDRFLDLHPDQNIRIINDSAPELVKSLRGGDVDLVVGLLPEEDPAEITGLPLAPTPYSVVARGDHPLTRHGPIEIADLAGYDWLVGTAGSSRRACFDRMFRSGARPKAPIETCALTVFNHLLKSSNRLTLMTSYELEYADDALRALPFIPQVPAPSIGIMIRSGWMPTKLHAGFIEVMRAHVAVAAATPRAAVPPNILRATERAVTA